MRKILMLVFVAVFSQSVLNAQTVNGTFPHRKGIASYYHEKFVGRKTATGTRFSNAQYTGASNRFPLGTYVKVTNMENNRTIYVLINDRMNARNQRLIDLTSLAAEKLGYKSKGVVQVKVEPVTTEEGRTAIAQPIGFI